MDVDSGLVHTFATMAAKVADLAEITEPLHGKEETMYADAGCIGVPKQAPERGRKWRVAAKRGSIKALPKGELKDVAKHVQYLKAAVRSKVEHLSASSNASVVTRSCASRG